MTQQYQELTEQLAALVDAEWPMVSNLANAARFYMKGWIA